MYTLNNGRSMPKLAYGTFRMNEADIKKALPKAIYAGYRHIDCAHIYGNEAHIGPILSECGEAREDLFITSKVFPNWYRDIKTRCQQTLEALKVEYLDLYLLHWPIAVKPQDPENWNNFDMTLPREKDNIPLIDAWRQMEALVDEGLVKSIGVSNWTVALLVDMLSFARIKPVCNQIEINIYGPNQRLIDFCLANEIIPTGHSIIMNPVGFRIATNTECPLDNAVVRELADCRNCTPAQVCFAWVLEKGAGVVAKTLERFQENLGAANVNLNSDDCKRLDALECGGYVCDPMVAWGVPLFD